MNKPAIFVCLFLNVLGVSAQITPGVIVFRHANVIDGVSKQPFRDVSLTIENGKITGIRKRLRRLPSNAQVIDLKGKWVLPGYIDAHVHLANFTDARTALVLGTTTARIMHCERFVDIQIRNAHRAGQKDLPDILAAGYQIRPDMFAAFFDDFPELSDMKTRVGGPANVRRVVRAIASRGVDHIKFLATERAGTPETDPRKRTFNNEEVAAIVDEARLAGLAVSAHAHGDEGAFAAVEAGSNSIEHGTFIRDATLNLMKQKGTCFVPTFTGGAQQGSRAQDQSHPVLQARRNVAISLRNELVRRSAELGIPIAAGTDLRYNNRDLSMADEAQYMHTAGLDPLTIIQIMTSGSARCLGIDKRTGIIKRGFEADLVVLAENPLTSIAALRDIRIVVNDGKVVFMDLARRES